MNAMTRRRSRDRKARRKMHKVLKACQIANKQHHTEVTMRAVKALRKWLGK